eukprot:TRINITY_DN13197_c0_g2_i2.p1 TRINITY_DN13197_c0_g2~~TRINITY_DN13197_c0_g2_i2.p1  ORF type:complete len:599 (+),score=123.87 TRINITY_DN13197_c0_g2_i2:205-2001(+)
MNAIIYSFTNCPIVVQRETCAFLSVFVGAAPAAFAQNAEALFAHLGAILANPNATSDWMQAKETTAECISVALSKCEDPRMFTAYANDFANYLSQATVSPALSENTAFSQTVFQSWARLSLKFPGNVLTHFPSILTAGMNLLSRALTMNFDFEHEEKEVVLVQGKSQDKPDGVDTIEVRKTIASCLQILMKELGVLVALPFLFDVYVELMKLVEQYQFADVAAPVFRAAITALSVFLTHKNGDLTVPEMTEVARCFMKPNFHLELGGSEEIVNLAQDLQQLLQDHARIFRQVPLSPQYARTLLEWVDAIHTLPDTDDDQNDDEEMGDEDEPKSGLDKETALSTAQDVADLCDELLKLINQPDQPTLSRLTSFANRYLASRTAAHYTFGLRLWVSLIEVVGQGLEPHVQALVPLLLQATMSEQPHDRQCGTFALGLLAEKIRPETLRPLIPDILARLEKLCDDSEQNTFPFVFDNAVGAMLKCCCYHGETITACGRPLGMFIFQSLSRLPLRADTAENGPICSLLITMIEQQNENVLGAGGMNLPQILQLLCQQFENMNGTELSRFRECLRNFGNQQLLQTSMSVMSVVGRTALQHLLA